MPPVLHVAFDELARRGENEVRTRQLGRGVHQRQHVLQLVAKAERAARLVERGAAPQARTDQLVEQPAVGERVDGTCSACARRPRRASRASARGRRRARACATSAPRHARTCSLTSLGAAAGAEAKDDGPFRSGARDRRRRAAPRTDRALRRRGPTDAACRRAAGAARLPSAPMKSPRSAHASTAPKPLAVDVEVGDAFGEVGVVAVAREDRAGRGVELGDDVHRGLRALVAEHPLDVAGDAEAAPRAPTGCAASAPRTSAPPRRRRRRRARSRCRPRRARSGCSRSRGAPRRCRGRASAAGSATRTRRSLRRARRAPRCSDR